MSCILTVLGKTFDVDHFVQSTKMVGFKKRFKGEIISLSRQKKLEYSYASIEISGGGFDSLEKQIVDAEVFLRLNKENLSSIKTAEGVDFATINFGSNLNGENVQSFFFPPTLLLLCAELKLGIEITAYSI